MLSLGELRLLYEIVKGMEFTDEEKSKLQKKLSYIVQILDIQEKTQSEVAEIQNKVMELEKGEENETKEEQ